MFYVFFGWEGNFVASFGSFEEADDYISRQAYPDDYWITEEEDGGIQDYEESLLILYSEDFYY